MSCKILIIGAGAAGIAAATRLFEKGFRNVQILEATNRIGGRVNTVPFGDNVIDLGAQWCTGEKGNAVFGLANPLQLLEPSIIATENAIVKSTGEVVPQEITDRLMAVAEQVFESEEIKSYDGTLGDFVTQQYLKAMSDSIMSDIDSELALQFLVHYQNSRMGYIAIDSWYNLTAAGSAAGEDCEGDQTLSWMGKGYKSVLELLMKKHPAQQSEPIPIESKVEFNKFVTNIHWNKGPDNPATVRCADGTQYDADHIILTASIGVLKEHLNSMFTPELPRVKQNAIKGIHLGTVNKVIMEFDVPFWEGKSNTFGLIWNAQELEKLQSSKYAWTAGVLSFFKIDRQPKLLAAWMNGVEARQMELLDDETVTDGMMFLMKKFFKNDSLQKPVNIIRSKWFSDRNFRGTYSSRSLTTELLQTGHEDMAIPLTDCLGTPVLLFAGEATEERYYGTVHGAISSGWREAERIVDHYKTEK